MQCTCKTACSGSVAIVFRRGKISAAVDPLLHISGVWRWKSNNSSSFNSRAGVGGGGGYSHMKRAGMLVVSLKGVNFGFWSHLRCSGQDAIINKP